MSRDEVLTDSQWERLLGLMAAVDAKRGRPFRDHRQVVEGIVSRYRAGIPWRDLPERSGPWQTVWKRHAQFSRDGTWDAIWTRMLAEEDGGGHVDWAPSVDSTVNRAHQHAANTKRVAVAAGGLGATQGADPA